MDKMSLKDFDVQGKRVLVRVDFNVPMDKEKNITNDTRIRSALPTINYLLEQGAKVILVSHLGRPKGQINSEYSLAPVAKRLEELVGKTVLLGNATIDEKTKDLALNLKQGELLLLENIRFYAGEEKNDPELCQTLASLADLYINDAFGTAHRAHASTTGVAEYLPAAAGFLLEKEIGIMGTALEAPARPFVAILGGAKVSDKILVIENLLDKVDSLIIGGGIANNFLKAKGYEIGKSLVENEKIDLAKDLIKKAEAKNVKLYLPVDGLVAAEFKEDAPYEIVDADKIPADMMLLDMGPKTRELFIEVISKAKTIVWNGPMGVFEMDAFAGGTIEVAKAMAEVDGITIIGGGDSIAAVEKAGVTSQITHISTGGGASLEFLEGKKLPGVEALKDKKSS